MPLKYSAIPASFAAWITSSSLILPPGSIMDFTPASAAASIESLNGKNASLAIEQPFKSIDAAAEAGVKSIIEPGGSIRDDEVIEAANEFDIALYFSGKRHFLH